MRSDWSMKENIVLRLAINSIEFNAVIVVAVMFFVNCHATTILRLFGYNALAIHRHDILARITLRLNCNGGVED